MPKTSAKTAKPHTKPAHKPVHKAEKEEKNVKEAPAKKIVSSDIAKAVGRRKSASARVRITAGTGKITVNGMDFKKYFPFFVWQEIVISPLRSLSKENSLDVSAKVAGGGKNGQAESVRHGIARALVKWNEDFKKSLKATGYLTRDARVKERKKFGLKRARRAPQWSKR